MSKHVETLRSVLLFGTVVLLILVLYKRLLFVMGKRKSMTATSDLTVRMDTSQSSKTVVIESKFVRDAVVSIHSSEQPEGQVVHNGKVEAGITHLEIPNTTQSKPYCKVRVGNEEFNIYF
jgi:hypothetical protein